MGGQLPKVTQLSVVELPQLQSSAPLKDGAQRT